MPVVPAFRCAGCGIYYPSDYVKEWGRKYGIGLGPEPISESLDTDYLGSIAGTDQETAMHPVGVRRCQVDFVMVEETEYESKKAIIALEDKTMNKRVAIMRNKQIENSPKLRGLVGVPKNPNQEIV